MAALPDAPQKIGVISESGSALVRTWLQYVVGGGGGGGGGGEATFAWSTVSGLYGLDRKRKEGKKRGPSRTSKAARLPPKAPVAV